MGVKVISKSKARQYTIEEIREIAAIAGLPSAQKNDPASLTLAAPALQGSFGGGTPYGLFARPGARPQTLSTFTRPYTLARALGNPRPSEYIFEDFDVMTGVTRSSGTNATGWTGNPPEAGQAKAARLRFEWGNIYGKTALNAIPEIGLLKDRADVPHELLNAPPELNPLIPEMLYALRDTRSQLRYELWRFGVDLERSLENVLITGDKSRAYSASQLFFFKEFDGLDLFVKTGYTDSSGYPAVPALDSVVATFGVDVGSTIAGGDGRNLVQAIGDIMWGLKTNARNAGFEGVQWIIVMRAEAFRSVVENYACNYATYRCNTGASAGLPQVQDATATNALRLEMLEGQYLLIDNIPVPVVFSEGVPQQTLANATYKSDMYFVPLSWQGMPLTYVEYFPLNNQYATEYYNMLPGTQKLIMNNGQYVVGSRGTGLADEYHIGAKMRLVVEAPWLCGRLDDINYTFRAPYRPAMPGTSGYVNGGYTNWAG